MLVAFIVWDVGLLALIVRRGDQAGAGLWARWCAATSAVSPTQPALAQQLPLALAGRARSADNLVICSGVFALACALSFPWLQLCPWRERAASVLAAAR